MDWECYTKIIDQLCEIQYNGRVALMLSNEPLLETRLEKMIEYALGKLSADRIHSRERREAEFAAMTIAFELGEKYKSKSKGEVYLEEVKDSFGSIDKILGDLRYRPMWLYNIGIVKVCSGDIKDAESYFEQIRQCKLCVICECTDCFEYYFGMGLIAELNNQYDKAMVLYKEAIKLKGDYPCAQRHLNIVAEKLNKK